MGMGFEKDFILENQFPFSMPDSLSRLRLKICLRVYCSYVRIPTILHPAKRTKNARSKFRSKRHTRYSISAAVSRSYVYKDMNEAMEPYQRVNNLCLPA